MVGKNQFRANCCLQKFSFPLLIHLDYLAFTYAEFHVRFQPT